MKICTLVVVCMSYLSFAGEPPPKTAGEAEMRFNRKYNEAKDVFDKAVAAAKAEYVAFLKAEMKRLTIKGDLDEAIAIRDKIGILESEQEPKPREMQLPSGTPLCLVDVPATASKNNPVRTGIRAKKGDRFSFRVSGTWNTGMSSKQKMWPSHLGLDASAGSAGKINWMSLVVRVGSILSQVRDGEFIVPKDGELEFYCNDDTNGNNKGAMKVLISKH